MADETEGGGPDPERLEKLEGDIEQARANADEQRGPDEPTFKQRGEASDEVVDDTIVPPG
jgi:hypothetical protein